MTVSPQSWGTGVLSTPLDGLSLYIARASVAIFEFGRCAVAAAPTPPPAHQPLTVKRSFVLDGDT